MKTLFKNFKTTIMGCFAGLPMLIKGIEMGSVPMIVSGAGAFLLGLFSKDAHNPE